MNIVDQILVAAALLASASNAVIDQAATVAQPAERGAMMQLTPLGPPPPTPAETVNVLPYELYVAAPALQAYRIVATERGWPAELVAAWEPFVDNVMYGESGYCWNRLRGDVMVYPPDGCRQIRQGPHTDAGFGQVTPIAGYRPDLWMCQEHDICSKWDVIQDPWHSMLALVLLVEREGSQPWCYNSFARSYHDCTLAPDRRNR